MTAPVLDHSKAVTDVGRRLDTLADQAHQLADTLDTAVDHCQVAIGLCRRLRERLDRCR